MKLFRWLNVFVIFFTFIAYLAPYISPLIFWPIAFFGIAYPWLLLLNFLFLFYWLFRKEPYFLMSLFCIIIGWSHLTNILAIHSSSKPGALQVMSYNVMSLKDLRGKDQETRKAKKTRFINFVKSIHPELDIFCGQEVSQQNIDFLKKRLELPHGFKVSYKSSIILSKHPFIDKGEVPFKKTSNSCIWVDFVFQKDTIRIYSVHLQSTKVSKQTEKVIAEPELRERETWQDIKSIVAKVKSASQKRARQAEKVAAHIQTSPYPAIVCGDFNDTPQSYAYRLIARGLKDNFRKKGSGIGTTYAGSIPGLRIDFILTDPRFEVGNFITRKEKYSDHYPIFSSLTLGGE